MNRIYKFRAWDKKRNCWNFTLFDFDADGEMLTADWFEINQFTGLKDKNNVDVYEHDILRHTNEEADHTPYAVPEMTLQGMEIIIGIGDSEWDMGNGQYSNIEVIGNIYQNKELLLKG